MELLIAILLCARATEQVLSLMMKIPQPDPEKAANSQLPFPLTADYCLEKHKSRLGQRTENPVPWALAGTG